MNITGTHINYYLICHRKLWLFANSIQMEHTNDAVSEGKLIHETTYQNRSSKYEEIEIEGIKIDYFDTKNKVIHEIKKSSKLFEAHTWQVKYYIYVLENNGLDGVSGLLEYPRERKTEEVYLSEPDRKYLDETVSKIKEIIHLDICPPLLHEAKCKKCSYFDFCYAHES
jgi:CRISPR-associated exonuclease Cas4